MSRGSIVALTFVVFGMLAYFVGYSVGRYEAPKVHVPITCPAGTVPSVRADGVWACFDERDWR